MARPKVGENGTAEATTLSVTPAMEHDAIKLARAARERIAAQSPKASIPQAPLPAFAKGKDKASPKPPAGRPAAREKAVSLQPARPAKHVPTAFELTEFLADLKALRDAAKKASATLKRVKAQRWPIVDEDRDGEHLAPQVDNLLETDYRPGGGSVDMSLDATVEDLEALIGDVDPESPDQGEWARAILAAPARSGGKRPSARRAKAVDEGEGDGLAASGPAAVIPEDPPYVGDDDTDPGLDLDDDEDADEDDVDSSDLDDEDFEADDDDL